jgi:hypothetical protein
MEPSDSAQKSSYAAPYGGVAAGTDGIPAPDTLLQQVKIP